MSEEILAKTYATSWNSIRKSGFDVQTVGITEGAGERLLALGKSAVTPVMDVDNNDFATQDAFGFFLCQSGRDVAGVLSRCDNVGSEPINEYWSRTLSRQYRNVGPVSVRAQAAPGLKDVSGRVAYSGDLFRSERDRGSLSVIVDFVRLLHVTAAFRWSPDWHYAFLRQRDVERGMADRYGFTRRVAGVNNWSKSLGGRSNGEVFVASPRNEMIHNFSAYLRCEGVE